MLEAQKFLKGLGRCDLATLVSVCAARIVEKDVDNGWYTTPVQEVVIEAPPIVGDALKGLPPQDRKRIAEAIVSTASDIEPPDDIRIVKCDGGSLNPSTRLLSELLIHRAMMVSVAIGDVRIPDVNDYYKARETRLREEISKTISYQNPHKDLWSWYGHWKACSMSYAERIRYIREIFDAAIDEVSKQRGQRVVPRKLTGWERVDRVLEKAQAQLEEALDEEDCQSVGLLCREVIISLAQAVYDRELHGSLDEITPSDTDAKRMLEAFAVSEFPGASNKEVRAHVRASLALALNLQHRRTATKQLGALCVEATASTVSVISIIKSSHN